MTRAAPDTSNGHVWTKRLRDKWTACEVCGVVRRADDGNKPCRGPVKITTRAPDKAPAVVWVVESLGDGRWYFEDAFDSEDSAQWHLEYVKNYLDIEYEYRIARYVREEPTK